MKVKTLMLIGASLAAGSAANAALLVHYTFDNGDAANSGTLGDGTVAGGSAFVASSAGTNAGQAWQGNRTGANDARIETGLDGNALAMGATGAYTTMAWVSWAGTSGTSVDHMVFGQNDGIDDNNAAQLHHGIRDDSVANGHFGHWGNDVADAGVVPGDGTWTHMAFTWNATDGAEVFVNGASAGVNATAGALNNPALQVLIGAHTRDGSAANPYHSFNGLIDDVRIYDEVLDAAAIMTAMNAVNIPEPSTAGLLGLAAFGLIRRRR